MREHSDAKLAVVEAKSWNKPLTEGVYTCDDTLVEGEIEAGKRSIRLSSRGCCA